MRLDHLLSTENSGRCSASGVGPAGDVPWCGPAGVEEIMRAFGGMGMLLGSRTATPSFSAVRFVPLVAGSRVRGSSVLVRGGLRTG